MLLTQIPRDVLQLIADKLSFKDRMELKKTCKSIRELRIKYIPYYVYPHLNDEILNRKDMKNLRYLEVSHKSPITDIGIIGLYHLRYLHAVSENITDVGIMRLTNLTELNIRYNNKITGLALLHLTNLTYLDIRDTNMTNEGIQNLTKLTTLDMNRNMYITNNGLVHLTNLTYLGIRECVQINNTGIKHLTKLTQLDADYNSSITKEVITYLPALKTYKGMSVAHMSK